MLVLLGGEQVGDCVRPAMSLPPDTVSDGKQIRGRTRHQFPFAGCGKLSVPLS